MAKAPVSGGGGRSHNKTVEVSSDVVAKLAALLIGERTYRPGEVPPGYCSPSEVIEATGMSACHVKRMLRDKLAMGAVDRIMVGSGVNREYWYKIK